MKKFIHFPLFLCLALIFLRCVPSNSPNPNHFSTKKIEYKGELKYFKDRYGKEMYLSQGQNHGVYITLPECFEFVNYSAISLTGQSTFLCNENSTYFTIDNITENDIRYYRDYFESKKMKSEDKLNVLRAYVMEIRAIGLLNARKSVYSTTSTHQGKKILLGSVVGSLNTNANELYYQYGVVAAGGKYYVLQAIMSSNNNKYLRQDILEIFKSFRFK